MKPFNAKKNIEDVDEFIDFANEIFEYFLESFNKENGLLRDVCEDDCVGEDFGFIYTDRGMYLAEKMKSKLIEVGEAHYPGEDIWIESKLYQEN